MRLDVYLPQNQINFVWLHLVCLFYLVAIFSSPAIFNSNTTIAMQHFSMQSVNLMHSGILKFMLNLKIAHPMRIAQLACIIELGKVL